MTSSSAPTYFQTMSNIALPPTPSAAPHAHNHNLTSSPAQSQQEDNVQQQQHQQQQPQTANRPAVTPARKPVLRLELRDLSSAGTHSFLRLLHASDVLQDAVDTVLKLLYANLPQHCIPPTRSVTLILRSMGGVAYTTGLDFDDDHKEIHFSTNYIESIPEGRLKEEMRGVIVHEMVHCWQWNAYGTAPGGLIEGIADWVRLKADLGPPHWRRHADGNWDSGYERTGYFLEWLEHEFGHDIVRSINEGLRDCKYKEDAFWHKCCGKSVNCLWEEYKKRIGGDGKGEENEDGPAKSKELAD